MHAITWHAGKYRLKFTGTPLLMGIVNVTPDSFSDGGRFFSTESALHHAEELLAAGASILDIGGESTRPGSESVPSAEQLRRVVPVIEALATRHAVPISIDTTDAEVARAAIRAGASIINDTSAATDDPRMLECLLATDAGICLMHRKGVPRTMQQAPYYDDVVAEVFDYLRERVESLCASGVERERIAIDPGLGFGKTTEHNRLLLESIGTFHRIGCAMLVGHSRKRFLGDLFPDLDRDVATRIVSTRLADAGVHVLRIHYIRPITCFSQREQKPE